MYESEFDDNGIFIYSVKLCVYEKCMLFFCCFFMCLDNVIVWICDMRIYVDFEIDEVIWEYIVKEVVFDDVKRVRL